VRYWRKLQIGKRFDDANTELAAKRPLPETAEWYALNNLNGRLLPKFEVLPGMQTCKGPSIGWVDSPLTRWTGIRPYFTKSMGFATRFGRSWCK